MAETEATEARAAFEAEELAKIAVEGALTEAEAEGAIAQTNYE